MKYIHLPIQYRVILFSIQTGRAKFTLIIRLYMRGGIFIGKNSLGKGIN